MGRQSFRLKMSYVNDNNVEINLKSYNTTYYKYCKRDFKKFLTECLFKIATSQGKERKIYEDNLIYIYIENPFEKSAYDMAIIKKGKVLKLILEEEMNYGSC